MTSKQALHDLASQYTGPVTRLPKGRRTYGEREMHLRTDASDWEVQEARIERELAERLRRKS